MSASLQGKVAIVTGSARGIGATIAIELAHQGANVVINYVSPSSKTRAEEVAKTVEAFGSKALVVQADLANLEDLDNLVKQTVSTFGRIDILVNNGGVVDFAPIGDIAAVAHMGEGGRIINISSIASRLGSPASTVYSASKAAVEGITRVMGIELRDKGIRVNAVGPGPVVTDMFTTLSKEEQEQWRSKFPVAEPSDIADSVLFLASSASRWITGTTLATNNGVILA
ncbi:hypothetical protein FRC17_010657 [Serendipita sp. 399]|nr:hypothetical protein FRC17_010657 [Serendipita sp. 399]